MRIVDRAGYVWASLVWEGSQLVSLDVPGAHLDGAVVDDPLLGKAHVITSNDQTTTMSALDWSRPTTIPTIAAPARLAPGAGGAIMNVIATLARNANVSALRYTGRYPTAALFKTLVRSFRTTATEAAFTASFTLAGDVVEIPIDFAPAPFERLGNAHGYVELRDGRIERAVVDRVSFEPDGSPARLVDHVTSAPTIDPAHPPGKRAEVWFGDAPYAHVATFAATGELVEGPHAIPRCKTEVVGQSFPPQLVEALADLVAEAVPAPLAEDARRYVTGATIRWADLGARTAAKTSDGLAVHAALWERVARLGLPRLALALAEALAPVVTTALVAAIANDVALMSRSE